jgi:acetyl esterase
MKFKSLLVLTLIPLQSDINALFSFGSAPVLEPRIAKFVQELEAQGGTPIYKLSPADAREVLEKVQDVPVKKQPTTIEDLMIPGPKKSKVSVRIVRPEGKNGPLPIIMYFHGGGWILGNKGTHDRLIRDIAHGAQAAVVFVNYTLSPEAHFPVAIEQCYAATKYFADNADKHNLDSKRLIIAGDSVGGNMVAVVALLAKERKGPKIRFQLMFYPVTDANLNTASYKKYAQGPWLTKPSMEWFWNAYEPDIEARKNYRLSPLQASLDQLKGLPPALIIVNENDVLRDEGEAYARKLMEAGNDVVSVRINGAIHDLVLLNPIADSLAARTALNLGIMHLKKAIQ